MTTAATTSTLDGKVAAFEGKAASVKAKAQVQGDYAMKFVCAAMSNMAASGVSNPLDIIKVRQQLRTATPGAKANAFWAVGAEMARKEGALSLMNGFTASMLREVVYSGLRLGSYELFKDQFYELSRGAFTREGLGLKVMAATCAATLGSALANPADLVKVRMQAHYPNGSPYHNTRHAFLSIYREGALSSASATALQFPALAGIRSLWRGVSPTTIRGIILSTSQICSYDQIKQMLKNRGVMQEGFALHLSASLCAGFICSVTSNPIDVVKVRLMTDKAGQFTNAMHCARTILVREGPLAFFKGFGMCWGRLGTHTIVSFLMFERLRSLFGMAPM